MKLTDDLKNSFIDLLKSISRDDGVKEKIDTIINYLEMKYNEKFELISYGDRYDKLDEEISILVHPKNDKKLVFKASGNNENVYKDNYLERKVFTEIEKNVEKEFQKEKFSSDVKISAVVNRVLEKEETVEESISNDHFLIAIIAVDNRESFEKIEKIINIIKHKYIDIKIKVFAYLLDNENYGRYKNYSNKNQKMSQAMIRKYLPIDYKVVF